MRYESPWIATIDLIAARDLNVLSHGSKVTMIPKLSTHGLNFLLLALAE